MKVIFMGTPDFAVGTLQALLDSRHEVVAVYTQPDKPKGRGKELSMSPVKELALKHNLKVYQPVKIREPEYVEQIQKMGADVIVVTAFGQILPKAILEAPKYGCINVHASLLPKYRGAAPIQWAVIDGQSEAGVTTMQMNEGLDTGDMLLKKVIQLDPKETGGSLFDKLSVEGAKLLIETLQAAEDGTLQPQKQDDLKATYARMLDKSLGRLDFSKDAVVLERLIRGLNPWPSAYGKYNGKTLKIWDADVTEENFDGACGEIVAVDKDSITVKCAKGALVIHELQLEGKKRMCTADFLRGCRVSTGEMILN
jgi:methionyl-tRNA formyltransferase